MYNGNWTGWSAIWSEIIRVILKWEERAAWVRFEITSMISDQNCRTSSSITTLLQPFWNRRIQSVPIFYWASEVGKIYRFVWGRGGTLRICIFVNFQQITFKLGSFTKLKAFFSVVSTDFRQLGHVKSWKNREKVSTQFLQILFVTTVYVKREAWPFLISFNRQ